MSGSNSFLQTCAVTCGCRLATCIFPFEFVDLILYATTSPDILLRMYKGECMSNIHCT